MNQRRRRSPDWPQVALLEVELARLLRRERRAAGWTQSRLAQSVGISQSRLSRYETLTAWRPRIDVYARAFHALGVLVRLQAERLNEWPRQDRAHAFVLAYILRRLPPGWLRDTEVAVRQGEHRGWIDLLLFHPHARILLVIEIKTEVHDIGEILRRMRWHTDRAPAAAAARGWAAHTVLPVLLVLATREAADRLDEASPLIATALPGDAKRLLALLDEGSAPATPEQALGAGFVALVDPLSRRAGWLESIPSRGRRPRTRWANYAEFARAVEGRRLRRPAKQAARAVAG